VHVNLKEELSPYKPVIGQILLRLPNVQMVVNKSSNIDNTFRNFEMEILAKKSEEEMNKNVDKSLMKKKIDGDSSDSFERNDFVVSVRENGARFMFDFSKVYWNPRLVTEHQKIVDLLKAGDILFDVFAGVGPFSVPAAMKAKVSKTQPTGIR
jgi:tRNA (guanine37-N1)-methyltransferase